MYFSQLPEQWKPVSFEGLHPEARYEISNLGNLRIWQASAQRWQVLTPVGKTYLYFTAFKSVNGWKKRITKPLHRLVAAAFIPNPSSKKFVIHLDYNKQNNSSTNLRWATQKELTAHNKSNPNVLKAIAKKKGQVTNAKLTEADVRRLKLKLKRSKNRLQQLAKEFGITHTQLNRIRSGENWGHVRIN